MNLSKIKESVLKKCVAVGLITLVSGLALYFRDPDFTLFTIILILIIVLVSWRW